MTLQVALSQDFFDALIEIPREKQKKLNKMIREFRRNPESSSINYEKINDAANPQFRSVRLDQEYRGIVLKPERGNVYVLLWVDKHDEAYDWARRHRCEINPETGSLQLYEVMREGSEAGAEAAAMTSPEPSAGDQPLIGARERELRRLGVPEDRLEAVQALTSQTELDAMESRLPVEAFEALCFLAEGLTMEEVQKEYAVADEPQQVDTTDISAALERDHSRRRFHVVEDDEELTRMLEAPLEQWRVFLHPSQRRLVERDWNGPVRVLGGAGTGKTVVAMHRARWLVRNRLQSDEKLLFTTFTRNLATDIETNLRKICSTSEMEQIEVTNIDAWVSRFLKREGHSGRIVYPGTDDFDRCWDRAMGLAPGELDLPESFYREELEQVILPQRIMNHREYFKARRIGRGTPLNRQQRHQIWPVFEELRLQLHQNGLMTGPDAVYAAIDLLNEGATVRPYRSAVVDETQDMGAEVLQLIRALVPEGQKNDLMLVGDGHQRIYGRRTSLSQCGINIRGRGRKLRVNYRTTEEIRRQAVGVLENISVDDLDEGEDPQTGYRSLVLGSRPLLQGFDTPDEEADWVVSRIKELKEAGLEPSDICVVARTRNQFLSVEKALQDAGDESYELQRSTSENTSRTGIRLANMHRVKGLEFKAVFLVGIQKGVVPLGIATRGTYDPVQKRLLDLNERALLHVAMSRAVQSLCVSWVGEPSEYLVSSG